MARARTLGASLTMMVLVAAAVLIGPLASSAGAADAPKLAGTWTLQLTWASSDLPAGFEQRSGPRTYYFGSGCGTAPCKIERTNQDGKVLPQDVTWTGSGWKWTNTQVLDCSDTVTGALTTPQGADWTTTFTFRPTDTVTLDGVTYASSIVGTASSVLSVNARGRADNCTVTGTDKVRAEAKGAVTGKPTPLAVQVKAGGDLPFDEVLKQIGSLGIAQAATTGSLPAFTLPMSDYQRDSKAAVERGDRSSIPASVVLPGDAGGGGNRLLQNVVLAALLGLLMVFPSELFNRTYEENHVRIETVVARRLGRRAERTEASAGRRRATFAAVAVAGAVIGGFLDPKFGANRASAMMLLGVFVSMLFGMGVSIATGRTFRQRIGKEPNWTLHPVPSGLVIASVCVLVSRLVGFQPGYLYGLVGGAAFVAILDRAQKGLGATVGIGVGLVLAFAAWLALSPVGHAANHAHPAIPILILDSLLAGLFIGGIEGMLFSLVPIRFFPGATIKQWRLPVWIVLTGIVSFTFVNVLLRPASGYLGRSTTASVTVTITLFVVFAVFSVGFWGYFRLRPSPPGADPEPVDPGTSDAAATEPEVPAADTADAPETAETAEIAGATR